MEQMKDNRIALILPNVDNSFFGSLARNIEKQLSQSGYFTLICSCDNDAEKEIAYMKQMSGLGVKGILSVSGLSKLPSDPAYDHIPLVWIDRVPKADRQIPMSLS